MEKIGSLQTSQRLLEVSSWKISHADFSELRNCGEKLFNVETAVVFSKTFEGTGHTSTQNDL